MILKNVFNLKIEKKLEAWYNLKKLFIVVFENTRPLKII